MNDPQQSDELSDLIRETELLQEKIKMDLQFKKNMEFFKKTTPQIYHKMKDFRPQYLRLYVDENKQINLLNLKTGKPIYDDTPKAFAKSQIDYFLDHPYRLSLYFREADVANKKHIHPPSINKARAQYEALGFKNLYKKDNPVGLAVVLGCGMGYQIKELIETHHIMNLIIYDRIDDGFYASLYAIDWEEVAQYIHKQKGRFFVFTGDNNDLVIQKLRSVNYHLGIHNMSNNIIIHHTKSNDNDKFLDDLIKEYTIQASALGFYDDEQTSFSHTVYNINQNYPVLTAHKKTNLPPVFVIGNGPSLDDLAEVVRMNQDYAIIISCGSALTALYALGIKPDLHVEQERVYAIAQMLALGTDLEYTKQIPLLMLNTVTPAVSERFSEVYVGIKPNDLGAAVLEKLIPNKEYHELLFCNPTVTNCGLAFALSLGFDQVYLVGTDYGMPNTSAHHSKHSVWGKLEENQENSDAEAAPVGDYRYHNNQFAVKGNLVDEVLTNPILNNSKMSVELLLKLNAIACYNINNGAYIEGAQPLRKEDLVFDKKIDNKKAVVQSILTTSFKQFNFKPIHKDDAGRDYISILHQAKDALMLSEDCQDMFDLQRQLDQIFFNINKISQICKPVSLLVRGSFNTHAGMLIHYASRAKDHEEFIRCYTIGQQVYNQFIDDILVSLSNDPLMLDDTMAIE